MLVSRNRDTDGRPPIRLLRGDETVEAMNAAAEYAQARTAPGIVLPGAYGAAFSALSSLPVAKGTWSEVTNKPYDCVLMKNGIRRIVHPAVYALTAPIYPQPQVPPFSVTPLRNQRLPPELMVCFAP